jgi:GDPmannose 4,6-dehydratase
LAGLDYRKHVVSDPKLYRPAEVEVLIGDATKARKILGWSLGRTFRSLVGEMLEADCHLAGVELQKRSEVSTSM